MIDYLKISLDDHVDIWKRLDILRQDGMLMLLAELSKQNSA